LWRKGAYGWPIIWRALRRVAFRQAKERVRKLLTVDGLRARGERKFTATAKSSHGLPLAPHLLERRLTVAAPKRVWAVAITTVWTAEGWRDRAVVIDLFSRQMAAMRERMTRPLFIARLRMARFFDRAYLHGPAA